MLKTVIGASVVLLVCAVVLANVARTSLHKGAGDKGAPKIEAPVEPAVPAR